MDTPPSLFFFPPPPPQQCDDPPIRHRTLTSCSRERERPPLIFRDKNWDFWMLSIDDEKRGMCVLRAHWGDLLIMVFSSSSSSSSFSSLLLSIPFLQRHCAQMRGESVPSACLTVSPLHNNISYSRKVFLMINDLMAVNYEWDEEASLSKILSTAIDHAQSLKAYHITLLCGTGRDGERRDTRCVSWGGVGGVVILVANQ